MASGYLRITEVIEICGVDKEFVLRLEQEQMISPVVRQKEKMLRRLGQELKK
jgi:hypothetical protein